MIKKKRATDLYRTLYTSKQGKYPIGKSSFMLLLSFPFLQSLMDTVHLIVVICYMLIQSGCGTTDHDACVPDVAYMQYFSMRPNVWIKEENPPAPNVYTLGFDLISPDETTHKGIVYQNRKKQRFNDDEQKAIRIEGSALLKKEGKDQNYPAYVNITCFHMRPVGSLGNLLFQYATLVGLCNFREAPPHNCANLLASHHSVGKAVEDMRKLFNPPEAICPIHAGFFHDHNSSSSYEIHFLPSALVQPVGTTYLGFFQSYKYFSTPGAAQTVRDIFQVPQYIKEKVSTYLHRFRSRAASIHRLVCVSYPRSVASFIKHHPFINADTMNFDYYNKSIQEFLKGSGEDVRVNIILVPVGHRVEDINIASDINDKKYDYNINDLVIQHFNNTKNVQVFDAGDHFIGPDDDGLALATLIQCPYLVLSSASLSWWGGFLANHTNVIAPKFLQLIHQFKVEDYYPNSWKLLS